MALRDEVVLDRIEVLNSKHGIIMQVQYSRNIFDDDTFLSSSSIRTSFMKDDDYSGQPQIVKDVCAAAFAHSLG